MSLQIWLPLNGNLNNHGLKDIVITNHGATINANGKIGKCYDFTGESYLTISNGAIGITNGNDFSCCYWLKELENNTVNQFRVIYQCGNLIIGQYGSSLNIYNAGGSGLNVVANIDTTQWHHCVFTFEGSTNTISIYIDGELKKSSVVTSIPTTSTSAYIGKRSTNTYLFNGYLNDFRIYDHCLSPREVKEISKGLVLHYPLNDPYVEGSTNINSFINQGIDDTCYNGATSKYGYGTSTDIYKVTGEFQGKKCTKVYMGTAGQDAWPFVHFTDMPPANGKYKTISFDYYPTSQNKINFYTHNGTATLTSVVNGDAVNNATMTVNLNQWNHISVTLLGTSDKTSGWGYMKIGTAKHTSTTTDYWLFANVQIEVNDHETPYTSNSRTTESVVYDCSGFGYNGTVCSGGLNCVDNSPRYDKCYYFNGISKYIVTPTLTTSGFANTYTFSWWGKVPSFSSVMFWGFGNGNRLNYYSGLYCNTGDGSNNPFYSSGTTTISTPSVNTWHHFAMVGNGSSTLLYVDGSLYGTAKTYKPLTGTTIYINGWDSGTSYKTNGYISDFRIYATALSASDIKELYNAPISITDNGTLITQGELVE